jgi:hexosaminidase
MQNLLKTILTQLLIVILLIGARAAPGSSGTPHVIPLPAEYQLTDGRFKLSPQTKILAGSDLSGEASYLRRRLEAATGYTFQISTEEVKESAGGAILLKLNQQMDSGAEGYRLRVEPKGVTIEAPQPPGVFYGIQTLLQLFPTEIYSDTPVEGVEWTARAVEIKDRPRFGWRAYLLDDARWFHGLETVKSMLDQLAYLKMNTLHWYLTDDQGWRLEIKRYPKLTEVGSRRKDSQVGGWRSEQRTGQPHQGFYTQQQVRELVRYAAERHITVVPVISMPGHASAAIASYPEMGTSGEKIEVEVTFGVKLNTFNVADENVYRFLQNILDEVMELFPSEVIHLGGDEVKFDQWMKSERVREMMKRENLQGPADVQRYFTNRMSRFLESRGRRMIGWNDILGHDLHGFLNNVGAAEISSQSGAGRLAKNTIVNFWKGDIELAEGAVQQGYDIINSLHSSTYLDYTYQSIPVEKAYAFDPIPEGLPAQFHHKVLGLGCQMWGEWIPTRDRLEYQSFPRLAAYAEIGWSARETKDYEDFLRRLQVQKLRWQRQSINCADQP